MRKINLGCGENILDDWENYDLFPFNKKVERIDIDKLPLPFDSESIDEILLSHTFEHLNINRHYLMLEFYRILRDGGKLTISVPLYNDAVTHTKPYFPKGYFNCYLKFDSQNVEYRKKMFSKIEVETIGKNLFTKIAKRIGFLEALFPRLLYGERIFKFVK